MKYKVILHFDNDSYAKANAIRFDMFVQQELHTIHYIPRNRDTNKHMVITDNKVRMYLLSFALLLPGEQRKRVLGRRNNKSFRIIQYNT